MALVMSAVEAKEAAVREVAKLLPLPENLSNISAIRADYLQKQQANDAQLSTSVMNQVEQAKEGIRALVTSQTSVAKLRGNFDAINRLCEECKGLIENHDRIKLLSIVRNNLDTTMKDLEGLLSISQEAADARESLKDGRELVRTFESLTALEGKRRFALAAVSSRHVEAGKLSEYFEDVNRTRETFEQTLWSHIGNFMKLSRESPQTLVRALRVVEMQEMLDQQAADEAEAEAEGGVSTSGRTSPANPSRRSSMVSVPDKPRKGGRAYKDKAYETIQRAVDLRFSNLLTKLVLEDLKAALEEASAIANDLPDAFDYVGPCFPPRYEIFNLLVQMYTTNFVTMLQKLGDRIDQLSNLHILKVMGWVAQYQEQLLEFGVDESVASALAECGAMDPLMLTYLERMQSTMQKWYMNMLEADKEADKTTGPKHHENGKLYTPVAHDLFEALQEQISVVQENSTSLMLFRAAEAIIKIMLDFQAAQRTRFATPIVDLGLEPLCAIINNNVRCHDLALEMGNALIEKLPPQYADELNFEAPCKGFLDVAKEAVQLTVAVIFEDPGVKELVAKLYKKDWYDGLVTEYLIATFGDYFGDVKTYIEDRSYRRFCEACLEKTVICYMDHLLMQKGYIKEETLARLKQDEQMLAEFFREHINVTKVEKRVQPLADISDLAAGESVESFLITYSQMLQMHPDCSPEVVEKIVALRENIPKKERQEVIQQCREAWEAHLRGVGDPPRSGLVYSHLTFLSKGKRR